MFTRQLEYLAALDRARHGGRAAAACRVSQPALSSAISGFERERGLPLVWRGRHFEGFTSEGERVLVWVHRALDDLTAHAGTGVPDITAHTWLDWHSLADRVRAIPLVEHTIGLVTESERQRSPVITELMAMFTPLELDALVRPARSAGA